MLPLLVLLGTITGAWYLLIVRPQKSHRTQHSSLIEQLRCGDHVLTIGGIYGQVVSIESGNVSLELAPSVTTRITTDGIARIIQSGDVSFSPQTQYQANTLISNHAQNTPMDNQMNEHPHSDQRQVEPVFAMPHYHPPQQPHQTVHQVLQHRPIQSMPSSETTTFEPKPWRDLVPINRSSQQIDLAPLSQPTNISHQQFLPQQPFKHTSQSVHQQPQVAHESRERSYSRAPKGMGSSMRIDDPSLRDTMIRARSERAELAQEYRKLTAPLVALDEPSLIASQKQFVVGHQTQKTNSLPRPTIAASNTEVDPALNRTVFQKQTPFSRAVGNFPARPTIAKQAPVSA